MWCPYSPLLWNLKSPTNLTYSYTGVSFGSMLPLTRWQQNSICASPEKQQFSPLFSSNSYGMVIHWKWDWWKPWYKITTWYIPRPEWQTHFSPFFHWCDIQPFCTLSLRPLLTRTIWIILPVLSISDPIYRSLRICSRLTLALMKAHRLQHLVLSCFNQGLIFSVLLWKPQFRQENKNSGRQQNCLL